jgi:hypothetical protein
LGLNHLGTPFVSRPNLSKNHHLDNTNAGENSITITPHNLHEVSKDDSEKIQRMKLELERKDRELREARRIIEEIKMQKQHVLNENGGRESRATEGKKGEGLKVYYETPRSREAMNANAGGIKPMSRGSRGLSGDKIRVSGDKMCESPKPGTPLRKSCNNAMTPTQEKNTSKLDPNQALLEPEELNGTRVTK